MTRSPIIVLLFAAVIAGQCGSAAAQGYADEDRDWGVAPVERIRGAPYTAPTPSAIPGAKLISTRELQALLGDGRTPKPGGPLLVDVAAGEGHATLPGAVWIPGAGRGSSFVDILQGQLIELLSKLTGADKARPLVFFCVNSQCWLSYNAGLRAAVAGYSQVYWYRGGIDAWRAAGFPLAKIDPAESR